MNDFDRAKREFREYYDSNIELLRDAETSFRTLILSVLADQPSFVTPHVVSRVKAREDCIAKFQHKYLPHLAQTRTPYAIQDYVVDLIGIRVICLFLPDIKEITRRLAAEFEVLDITDRAREVESTPDAFRYKGLHLTMSLTPRHTSRPAHSRLSSMRFEVQVRTAIQDAWSTLDHAIKYKKQVPHELCRRINALAALFEIADREFLAINNQMIRELRQCASSGTMDQRASTEFDDVPVLQRHVPRVRPDIDGSRGLVKGM